MTKANKKMIGRPTIYEKTMKNTVMRLRDDQNEWLVSVAKRRSISKAQQLRDIIDAEIKRNKKTLDKERDEMKARSSNEEKVTKEEISEYIRLMLDEWFFWEFDSWAAERQRELGERIKRDYGEAFQSRLCHRVRDIIDTIRRSDAPEGLDGRYEFTPTAIYNL